MQNKIISTIEWQPIDIGCCNLPPAEIEILVFDGHLNDVVKASLDYDQDNKMVWVEQTTGDPLPDPQFWADVPFPGDKK